MARSPLTLAAAATTALPDARITAVRALTTGASGRFDAAVATLEDGAEAVVRVPVADDALGEIETHLVALRALTPGVRDLLPFSAPEVLGSAPFGDTRVVVTSFLPGYQVEAADVPPGRGTAHELGEAIARIHALPPSVVRSAGLRERTSTEARAELERLLDVIGRSGRVPVRLMVRWREAAEDDRLWGYEPAVVLGGAQATSFVFGDDGEQPRVTGLVDWQGLQIGDPALDLHWTASAPDAADDVFAAYADASARAADPGLRVRARLHAELEFARWLVHGIEAHRSHVVDDASELLESLSAGLADDRLLADLPQAERADVSEAIALLDRMPDTSAPRVDTSLHTDAYDPDELTLHRGEQWDASPPRRDTTDEHTQPIDAADPATDEISTDRISRPD